MSGNVPNDPPDESLIRDIVQAYSSHGLDVPEHRVLESAIQALRGPSAVDNRSSTQLIFEDLVKTFDSPLSTQFVAGERHAYARSLQHITGEAHSGWLQRAADQSQQT